MDAVESDLAARVERDPDDLEAFESLVAKLRADHEHLKLVTVLTGWTERSGHNHRKPSALAEAARLLRGPLENPAAAIELLERSIAEWPADTELASELTASLPRNPDANARLVRVYESRVKEIQRLGLSSEAAASAMYDLGALWENVLHRPEKALANYRHATTLDPKNVSALYAARKLLLGSGDVLEALKLLDLEVTAEPNPQRKEQLLVELGHLRLEGTGDVASAIEAFERAHNLAPENPIATRMLAQALARQAELVDPSEAGQIRDVVASLFYELALTAPPEESLAYLEDALGAAPGHGPALELFEHHAIQLERNDLLPPRWVAYIEAKPEGAFTSIRRRRLGRAYIQNKQPMDAIACLEPIADRGDPEAADMLFDLYRTLGRDDDAARTMTIAVAGLPVEQRVPRLRDALHLRIDQGKYDEAVRCAREILVVAPADEVAFELLESEYTRRNELELLQGVYRNAARAPGVSDARRTQILASLARLSENKLGDVEAAVLAWEALRGIEPQNTDAARELERLFEAHKRWPELASALENATLGVTDLAERARLQRKLADLYAKRLDRPADAARALRSYRAMRPDDKAARDELAELLFRTRAFDEASALMRAQVAELPAGAKRTGLLRRLGALLETELDDPEGAYQMYTALLDEAPQDTSVLDALARLDAKLEQWERLLQTLAYYAELTQGAKQCALFMRMGEVAERELRDFDRSASFYGQALVIDGDSEAVLDALVRTYGRADRAEDLVRVLHEKAKREPNRTKRAAIRKRIARTLEAQFGASNATLEAWQRVLADDPESAEALRYAAENARRVGSPNELETILAKLADVVETELERVDLLVQRADLLAQKLDRRTEALAIMRSIVDDLNPGHLGALDWLRAHYESTNDMTQLAAVLDRQASVIAEPALRAPILRRLADLAAHQLSDPALSMHALERWSDDLPDDPEPLRRMAALLERDRQWIALRGIYDRLARIESDAARRNAVLRAAELSSTVLGDPDGAFARIRPLVENGDGEALSLLERIERKESIAPGAADARIKRADAERDANKRRNLWLDAARLLDGVPGEADRAFEITLRAFELNASDDRVLGALERRATAADRTQELAIALGRARTNLESTLASATTPKGRVAALVKLAHFAWNHLDDSSSFAGYVGQAVDAAGADPTLLDGIERGIASLESRGGLQPAETLVAELGRASDAADAEEEPAKRAELLRRASRLLAIELGAPWEAIDVIRNASFLNPGNEAILNELEAICLRAGAVRELEQHLDALAQQATEARPTIEALRRRGNVLVGLARFAEAAEVYRRLSMMSPKDRAFTRALADCLRHTESYEELVALLDRSLSRAESANERAELLREIAEIWEQKLDNPWEAERAWRTLLAARPNDPVAREGLMRLQDELHVATDPEMRRSDAPPR